MKWNEGEPRSANYYLTASRSNDGGVYRTVLWFNPSSPEKWWSGGALNNSEVRAWEYEVIGWMDIPEYPGEEALTLSAREKFLLGNIILPEWESLYLEGFEKHSYEGDDYIFEQKDYTEDDLRIRFLNLSEGEVMERRQELFDALHKILSKLSRFCGEFQDLARFGDFE